jgi:SAM-dependent methyltransferase
MLGITMKNTATQHQFTVYGDPADSVPASAAAVFSRAQKVSPLPDFRGPHYGVDAPAVPAVLGAAGVACWLAAARWRRGRIAMAAAGAVLLAHAGVYLHTTLRGKLRVWERELDRVGLKGSERLLDLGCGRGAVLIEASRRLPGGRAVGVDLWTGDQSGNSPEATLTNAVSAGVADRVEVRTADITALPFPDGTFDVVTSALAIHNIPSPEARYRALDEAMRVLRPGGQLLIADPWPMARKYAAHLGQGTLRPLGPGYWYGGPWLGTTMLHVVKER